MTLPPASARDRSLPAPAEVANTYIDVARRASRLLRRYARKTARKGIRFPSEEFEVARAFMDLSARLLASPYQMAQTQMEMMRGHISLWQQSTLRTMGMPFEAVATPDADDARFDDQAWKDDFLFDFIKQSYLITARHLQQTVAMAEGLDDATQREVNTRTRQYIDALSPTNFAFTNPEVLRETVDSKGKNLVKGLKHLLKDLMAGDDGHLCRVLAGGDAPRLGETLAATPGKVVFQNELMQLIQYQPAGSHQRRKPLLIIPPWTGRYYILDLRENNSYVRWATDQGFTTFIVSWVNPGPQQAQKNFEDYLVDGAMAAIDAVELATGEKQIDLVGYCLGGTLLMATLACMAARRDKRAASATFLATLIDFSEPGELGAFADSEAVPGAAGKPVDHRESADLAPALARSAYSMHANDLIWSFVMNNYLLGRRRFPTDLQHWNVDAARVPAALHRFCVDNFYRANRLLLPGGISLAGVAIDLASVKLPCYFLATLEDHVSPWKSVYRGARLAQGPARFVLGGSGHVAGTVNPPAARRYDYWTNESLPELADEFLSGATRHPGSWWTDWLQWLLAQPEGNTLVAARQPGDRALQVIEDAPGSYAARRGAQAGVRQTG